MLARLHYPLRYHWFNLAWGAPNGRVIRGLLSREGRMEPWRAKLVGCFGFQGNNTTRSFEYPWTFETVKPTPGLKVLEIGGSLSGLQFALNLAGCEVVNVDPGDEFFTGLWPATTANIERLNQIFGTSVTLKPCYLADAAFPDSSFDRVVSVSVCEHVPEAPLAEMLAEIRRVLKPGGLLILTVDLFLNVHPFESAQTNEYGQNVSIKWMADVSGFELVHGNRAELYGYPEFDWRAIAANRSQYLVGKYPSMVQTIVMRKPVDDARPAPA